MGTVSATDVDQLGVGIVRQLDTVSTPSPSERLGGQVTGTVSATDVDLVGVGVVGYCV